MKILEIIPDNELARTLEIAARDLVVNHQVLQTVLLRLSGVLKQSGKANLLKETLWRGSGDSVALVLSHLDEWCPSSEHIELAGRTNDLDKLKPIVQQMALLMPKKDFDNALATAVGALVGCPCSLRYLGADPIGDWKEPQKLNELLIKARFEYYRNPYIRPKIIDSIRILQDWGASIDLESAIIIGDEQRIRSQLDSNARLINSRNQEGLPLFVVAATLGQNKTIDGFIASGVDVNIRNEEAAHIYRDVTALQRAVFFQNLKVIYRLLDEGADVNIADSEDGDTALHIAAYVGNLEVARKLIEHGADKDVRNLKGERAFDRLDVGFNWNEWRFLE